MVRKNFVRTSVSATLLVGVVFWGFAAAAGPLDRVIEGAKKEGAVSVMLRTGFTPTSMKRLTKEINGKFGVNLDIKFTPSRSMPKQLAKALMEHKVGAPPTYDLMTFFPTQIEEGLRRGILESVDWKPLITADTNPEVVLENPAMRGSIVNYTGHLGLIYNPDKVSAAEVPKSLSGLTDVKWKNKIGVFVYSASWARWAFLLGKEKVLSDLRTLLKNGAIKGRYTDIYNRYLLGEISLCFVSSAYLKMARDKGVPAAWQHLDFAEIQNFAAVVLKGARNPNAAKLVAVYLASPSGARFTLEESGAGNLFYPGNYEHDLHSQAKKQGIDQVFVDRNTKLLEFYSTNKFKEWGQEVKLILDTGGGR